MTVLVDRPNRSKARPGVELVVKVVLFTAVGAASAPCVHRQTADLPDAPFGARLIILFFIIVWTFKAHSRVTFRGWAL